MIELGSRKPSFEMMELLADFFNVSLDYLRGDDDKSPYYLSPEVAEFAQQLYERPEMRILFDASRDATTEDVQMAADLLNRLSKK
jgi:transcriptional regulator with XRE-family HTH domain